MFNRIQWSDENLLKSTDSERDSERIEKVTEIIGDYNELVKLVEAFIKISRNLPNY